MLKIRLNNEPVSNFASIVDRLAVQLSDQGAISGVTIGMKAKTNLSFAVMLGACDQVGGIGVNLCKSVEPKGEKIYSFLHYLLFEKGKGEIEIQKISLHPLPLPVEAALVVRSSGTTSGKPKYICWGQKGIEHQIRSTTDRMGYLGNDRAVSTLPFWSSYGLSLYYLAKEQSIELISIDRFSPRYICQVISSLKATSFHSIPQLYSLLLSWLFKNPEQRALLRTVRIWDCGGDVLPKAVAQKWAHFVQNPILDGYGLTEAGPNVALNGPSFHRLGTVGLPLKDVQLKVSFEGELLIQSPSLMVGSINSEGNFDFHPKGEWFQTGDLAKVDSEGYVSLLGRKNNIVIIRGYNVVPEQVENTLAEFDGIEAAGVVGLEKNGHSILVAALKIGRPFPLDQLRAWARERLPVESIPKHFFPLNDLPLSQNGKVDRLELKKRIEQIGFLSQ